MTRALTVLAGATLTLVMTAGTASAHECFVVNRGGEPQGNAWFPIDVDNEIAGLVTAGFLTAAQAKCLTDALPSVAYVKVKGANGSGGVLIAKNPNLATKAADGKGIDHASAWFAACGAQFPA